MPLYEYQCDACGHRFEMIQKFSDPPLETCPKCGGAVRKLQSAPAFQFKGSGWYITDYAKKDQAAPAKDETSGEGDEGASEKDERADKSEKATKADKTEKATRPTRPTSRRRRDATRLDVGEHVVRAERRPSDRQAAGDSTTSGLAAGRQRFPAGTSRPSDREVRRELVGEVRPAQREVDDGFQEAELVAGVVADAFDLAGVDRPGLQQLAQAVGQLNLAGAIALGRGQRREDVGRQDVAADDRQVRRRFVASAASRPDRGPDRRRRRAARSARAR